MYLLSFVGIFARKCTDSGQKILDNEMGLCYYETKKF